MRVGFGEGALAPKCSRKSAAEERSPHIVPDRKGSSLLASPGPALQYLTHASCPSHTVVTEVSMSTSPSLRIGQWVCSFAAALALPALGCGSGTVTGVASGTGGGPTGAGGDTSSIGGATGTTGGSLGTGGAVVGSGGSGPATDASAGGAGGGSSAGTGGSTGTAGGGTGTGGRAGTGGAGPRDAGSVSDVVIVTPPSDAGRDEAGTCARWNADRADLSEGTWTGNVAACDPGDISAPGRVNALRLFNLYRWLADLPPVVNAPDRDLEAQACSLMMDANNMLSHTPPTTWLCYTALGAMGANTSNISGGPGVSSVDLYLIDTGNETTFGHRRIVLSNQLGPIGLGSTGTGGASCMQNIGGTGNAGKPWLAWPPPGAFPLQAYQTSARSSLSMTGWSFQSDKMNLANAQVTITSGGVTMPITLSQLTGNYGGNTAIRMLPMGWTAAAGQTYTVTVTGITTPISYDVQIVSCN
jgi:hypothetical protein